MTYVFMGLQRGQTAFPQTFVFSAQLKLAYLSASFNLFPQYKYSFIQMCGPQQEVRVVTMYCRNTSSEFLGKTKYHIRYNRVRASTL